LPELKQLFLQMAAILVFARLVAAAFRYIGQPAVVGEMAAGILLGPSFLGRFAPGVMNGLFPEGSLGPLYALSQVGLVLFMFLVGLEVRPGAIRESARSVIAASQASVAAPLLLGGALAWGLYSRLGDGAPKLPFILFMGTAMSVTAFPVLARILTDRGLTHTRAGVVAISCAAFDDLTAWCLLAIVTVVAQPETHQIPWPWRVAALAGYFLAMIGLVRPALRRFLPAGATPDLGRFGAVMILVLFSAWATESLGVHALIGAFLAGAIMPKGGKLQEELHRLVEPVTLTLLLPLFFAYNGLRTSFGLLNTVELWLLCGLIVTVAVGSKLLSSAFVLRACGMPWRESLAVGVLVNTRGLVELVILNVGLDLRISSPTVFSMMVIMALATTLMTTPLLHQILPATYRTERRAGSVSGSSPGS
jgi:Kef-type K+ transport system membrane component KefB